jgi:ethanolamine kinase
MSNLSPPIIAKFQNGFVYGYVNGTMFTPSDMVKKYSKVAKKLAIWHSLRFNDIKCESKLFTQMEAWIEAIPDSYTNKEVQLKSLKLIRKSQLKEEVI